MIRTFSGRGERGLFFATGLIVLVALALRLHHLDWALPHTYEEAKPLHVAFQMWGWDRGGDIDLNPGFFNYPSLVLYVHFVAQGLLYGALKLVGTIDSVTDWQVLFLTDPSTIYLAERGVTVLFAAGTVWVTAVIGRVIAGWFAGLLAALFLAVNPFHIARSQAIEVDVPMTFFVMLSLLATIRIAQGARARHYIIAGIAAGLATSSKYTGLFLIVPIVVAHCLSGRPRRIRALAMALGLACLAFACTSPYVLIDFQQFWTDFSAERVHMAEGHFGLSAGSSFMSYGSSLSGGVISLLASMLALAGIVLLIGRRRSHEALVLFVFAATYFLVISTWSMRADRYLLPLLPTLLIFAAAPLAALAQGRSLAGRVAALLLVIALCGFDLGRHARFVDAMHYDARTEATTWIETHVPAGTFILTEHYGPELAAPPFLMPLDPSLRELVLSRMKDRPVYALQRLPMTQTRPEQSAPYYSLDLYPYADMVLISSAVRGRYERDPERFRDQLAFYRRLETEMRTAQIFESPDGQEIRLTLYERAPGSPRFAVRDSVPPPPRFPTGTGGPGKEASLYFELATNYEYFGHSHEAYASYIRALDRRPEDSRLFLHCVLGAVRTLLSTGQTETAIRVLAQASRIAPDRDTKIKVEEMRQQLIEPGR